MLCAPFLITYQHETFNKISMQKLFALIACFIAVLAAEAQETKKDFVITVADNGSSGMFVATFCPQKDVAISKDDAEVFSIYMDMGNPNLSKLRIRNGQFVIKAGEPVVVKTTEAKTVTLGTSDRSSSTFINDAICLSADLSVEDFRKEHAVEDGATLYLLTNMAKNGGFGFTRFTGDTMKRGNFFIVVSKSKTRAAIDIEDGDPVPFLEGEAGNDDGFTAQSVYAKGDANGDGKINVADVVEMVNYIAGNPPASFIFTAADMNDDKAVDTTDVELLVNSIMAEK